MKSHKVRFWQIRRNNSSKQESWVVRWTVAGRERVGHAGAEGAGRQVPLAPDAGGRQGEAFDVDTGLPDSMAREVSTRTW